MVWTSDPAAYSKIILHSIRYPSQSVSGFLIGESVKKDGESVLHISDVLPLCHTNVQLLPNAEVGFSVAKAVAKEKKMRVIGYYYAPQLLEERTTSMTPFAEKIMKMITDGAGKQSTMAIQIVNNRVSVSGKECPLKFFDGNDLKGGRTNESGCFKLFSKGEEIQYSSFAPILESHIKKGLVSKLIDFEAHLDNPKLDFTNDSINKVF